MRSFADAPALALDSVRPARTRAAVATALLMGLASVLGLVEAAVAVPVPGARLGLANVAVVVALVALGPSRALAVSLGRVVIVALAAGTIAGPVFALAVGGAVASWSAMCLVARLVPGVTVVGISAAGGVAHVLAQLSVAALLAGTTGVFVLGSVSLTAGLLFGIAAGLASRLVISRMHGSDAFG